MNRLLTIQHQHPNLDRCGFGSPYRKSLRPFDTSDVPAFEASLELLGTLKPTKTFSGAANSYGLKHRVEDIHQTPTGGYLYCSNGVMIAAIIHLGLEWKPNSLERDDPNIEVKVSSREVRARVENHRKASAEMTADHSPLRQGEINFLTMARMCDAPVPSNATRVVFNYSNGGVDVVSRLTPHILDYTPLFSMRKARSWVHMLRPALEQMAQQSPDASHARNFMRLAR